MQRLLILGGHGFVGGHMRQMLHRDYDVVVPPQSLDIREPRDLERMVSESRPDFVVHLAAISSVPDSFADPFRTYNVNFLGTLNLLCALRSTGFSGALLFVGSSQVYGPRNSNEPPCTEESVTRPINPYAVSKLAAEALCYQWSQSEKFRIVLARPFNHIGPGQNENFVVPDFAKQISAIKKGLTPPVLKVGDIDVTRDFTDVRDVVRAYDLLLRKGANGETYNVCSGKQTPIREIVEHLLDIAQVKVEVVSETERKRVAEQKRMAGTYSKIHNATGWEPIIPLRESLISILNHYDQVVA